MKQVCNIGVHSPLHACAALALTVAACSTPPVRIVARQAAAREPSQEAATEAPIDEDSDSRFFRDLLSNTGKLGGTPSSESIDPAGVLSNDTQPLEGGTAGDVLVAPIPFLNPTIGVGLAVGAAYLFPMAENAPPSTLAGGVFYSDNGTRGVAAVFKGYFKDDKYRLTVGVANMRVNYDLSVEGFGAVPLQQDVIVGGAEFLVHVTERVYFGPQFVLSGLDTRIRQDDQQDAIDEEQLAADSVALGLRLQRDSRDSTFYPRAGSIADAQIRAYDEALGSQFTYQVIPLYYNAYFSPSERDVIAVRASARFSSGDVPFYGEGFFGSNSDLRGYTVGTLHDEALAAAQVEYRRELFWRLGAVAFGGVGSLAPTPAELFEANALPSVGFGLRVTLEEENHVNLRIDFAWGDGQSAVYFGVGEAF